MNEVFDEINLLFERIEEKRKTLKSSKTVSLSDIIKVCDDSSQMGSVLEFDKNSYSIAHNNKKSYDLLGVTQEETEGSGFEYVLDIIHPENMDSVYMLIRFFNEVNNYNKIFSYTFYIKTTNGWEWVYSMVKPVTFNEDGTVQYMLAVGYRLDDLLSIDNTDNQDEKVTVHSNLYEKNMEKYLSLTEREKEVLKLIAEEYNSKEIADKLFISPLTVDTHRKHLIEKLEVKSSIGLIKYAILFNLI